MTSTRQQSAQPAPITRSKAVEVFSNRFGRLYNDEVVSPAGTPGRYLRWQWAQSGVVVVPVGPRGLALTPMYRYPIGSASLEFPRGACDPGEAPEQAAARELLEETGLVASSVRGIGLLHADSGLIESSVHVCVATVDAPEGDAQSVAADPEAMESVAEPVWVAAEEMRGLLRRGELTCGVTLAAFALFLADREDT